MTTQSLFGVAGPFTSLDPLLASVETPLIDKVSGRNIILPAGSIVTELQIQRRGEPTAELLTAGKAIAVGIEGNPRCFTDTPGALTDDLNSEEEDGQIVKLDPTTSASGLVKADTVDKTVVIQCGMGASVESGSVAVIIKYKPFSKSVARRYNF